VLQYILHLKKILKAYFNIGTKAPMMLVVDILKSSLKEFKFHGHLIHQAAFNIVLPDLFNDGVKYKMLGPNIKEPKWFLNPLQLILYLHPNDKMVRDNWFFKLHKKRQMAYGNG